MIYEYVDGSKLDTILGAKTFGSRMVEVNEVQEATGLSIQELLMCWIFSSSNQFKKSLDEWKTKQKQMSYREIQGH